MTPDDVTLHETTDAPARPEVVAWRLVRPEFGSRMLAFSGEGARQYGGRWNSPGTAVVYASSSLALAALETLVHADRHAFDREYVAFRLRIPRAALLALADADLPDDWRVRVTSPGARRVGDAWARSRSSAALSVPSVIVPFERNYLLLPSHDRFDEIEIEPARRFRFDERLDHHAGT